MKVLITGGAGFIGINCSKAFLDRGDEVIIFDNLSRLGSEKNLEWLRSQGRFEFIKQDIRNFQHVRNLFEKHRDINVVLHMAAQVAVTTSVLKPLYDFEINLIGTINLLEAIRTLGLNPIVIFSSTNKVYGKMEDLGIMEENNRYQLRDLPQGVNESRTLDFYSPYGCSKGAADQYMLDYARIYGLRTIVFRKSCIYGYHQFGVEDQGWLAHFIISALLGKEITIYGDGKQVRDVLFIDDLRNAYMMAIKNVEKLKGMAYNIGGGPDNQISLLEVVSALERMLNRRIKLRFSNWRPGDQFVYVSDIKKAGGDFGWEPKISVTEGVEKLFRWVTDNRKLFINSELHKSTKP